MKKKSMQWDQMKSKPVAVFGKGISGQGVASLLNEFTWSYEFFDQTEKSFMDAKASQYSIVVTSPGFFPNHPWVKKAKASGVPVYGELDFASTFTNNKIVAVTGTNGKTSLVTLLCHIWKKAGKAAVCAGNIGTSLSSIIARGLNSQATIFLEVSSFQAQNIKFLSPDNLIWTNFSPDHQDYHLSLTEYFKAKYSLVTQLKGDGFAICGLSVHEFARLNHLPVLKELKGISRDLISHGDIQPGSFFSTFPQRENVALAYKISRQLGVSKKSFFTFLQSYQPEPSRLACIAEIDGVSFWNDSKATNFSATIAACKHFSNRLIWIGGGREKGESLAVLSKAMHGAIIHAFLIGEVASKLSKSLQSHQIKVTCCSTLNEAVRKAFSGAKQVTDILFSPAFASFDMFENYIERGNIFNKLVFDLKKGHTPCTQ
ncbi:MAG: UDP-N-acetylmuramoyl-L-alanine--D-glutamate ligase [Opitutales bacterium]|nr:UDP-N-acetylmuramoyl-L-alanine--D-glutamate ligase [Opitutales bacterium]